MPPLSTAEATDLLRERGVRVTAQRVAVLVAVAEDPHRTTDEIENAVRSELGAISRQAVYDVLAALTDAGAVRRIQPAGSPPRYEDRVGDNHHHLICRAVAGPSTSTVRSARSRASPRPTTRATRWTRPRSSTGVAAPIASRRLCHPKTDSPPPDHREMEST